MSKNIKKKVKPIANKAAEKRGSKFINGGSRKSDKLARLKLNCKRKIIWERASTEFYIYYSKIWLSWIEVLNFLKCHHAHKSSQALAVITSITIFKKNVKTLQILKKNVKNCQHCQHSRKGRLLSMVIDSVHRTLDSEKENRGISQSGWLDQVR